MARRYVVQSGDTLRSISQHFLGDPEKYRLIADYNGIYNPNLIQVGQVLEIPAKTDLISKPEPGPEIVSGAPATPQGLDQIIATFGDIRKFIAADGTLKPGWEQGHLDRAPLPFPIPLSWDLATSATRICCHRKLVPVFQEVFGAIVREGLREQIKTYGGCFMYRSKRTGAKPSTHSWGIAIDLNPLTNPMGSVGDLDPRIVDLFRRFGFKWGGDWAGKGKDPMHFQYCTGY
jgi:LysM repeat protein